MAHTDTPAWPRDDQALHDWIRQNLNVNIARTPMLDGCSAPFDYIRHAFFDDGPSPDCIVWANRGGGKTYLGALATALDLAFKPGIEVRIIGGSLEQSRRMHAHLRAFFDTDALRSLVKGRITDRRIRTTNGGAVELMAQSQTSVRGTRVQRVRCDEVELFDPAIWEAVQLTTRSKDCSGRLVRAGIECLSTMHVPHGLMHRLVREGGRRIFRWGVMDVLEKCDDRYECAACPLLPECDKRAKTKADGHVSIADAMAMKARVSAAAWESEMLCLRPSRTDAALPEFDPRVHVVRDDPAGPVTWLGGVDFGYRAPTVVLWGALDHADVLTIVGEHVESGLILDGHIEAMRRAPWPRPDWLGIDPAGAQVNDQTGTNNAHVLRRAGFAVRSRPSSVATGLELIRARLRPAHGPPRLFIHERCARLIASLESHRFKPGSESENPLKDGSDHAVDALRYMLVNLSGATATGNYLVAC